MKEEKSSFQVHAVLASDVHKKLKEKAAKANMNLSEFITSMINSREVITAKSDLRKEVKELIGWCGRLNSNLNMLAKHANTYKSDADATLILSQLSAIRHEVIGVMRLAGSIETKRRAKKKVAS